MSANAISTLDSQATEAEVLLGTLASVGRLHAEGDRYGFEELLVQLGMPVAEAVRYWGSLEAPTGGDPLQAKDNTALSSRLGVCLEHPHFARNQLLYRLVELHWPDMLSVRIREGEHIGGLNGKNNPHARRVVFDNAPRDIFGKVMPLCKVLQGETAQQFGDIVLKKAKPLEGALGETSSRRFTKLLTDLKMLVPDEPVMQLLGPVLRRGLNGQKVTLVGAFCPDYAYEPTGTPGIPFRYTFTGVGEGVGLVALQFARVIPPLSRFFTELGIAHDIVLGIGDFEADSESMLKRVGLDRAEFLARCRRSLGAFERLNLGVPIHLEMFEEERGKGRLRPYAEEATGKMLGGDFGLMPEVYPHFSDLVGDIGRQYGSFYCRWYDQQFTDREIFELVCGQGGEYAAMARIYAEDFGDNVIQIAGDRPAMHCFNAFYTRQPTLSAKRAY